MYINGRSSRNENKSFRLRRCGTDCTNRSTFPLARENGNIRGRQTTRTFEWTAAPNGIEPRKLYERIRSPDRIDCCVGTGKRNPRTTNGGRLVQINGDGEGREGGTRARVRPPENSDDAAVCQSSLCVERAECRESRPRGRHQTRDDGEIRIFRTDSARVCVVTQRWHARPKARRAYATKCSFDVREAYLHYSTPPSHTHAHACVFGVLM